MAHATLEAAPIPRATFQENLQETLFQAALGAVCGATSATLFALASPLTGAIYGGIQGCLWTVSAPISHQLFESSFIRSSRVAQVIANIVLESARCAIAMILTSALGFPITFKTALCLTAAILLTLIAILKLLEFVFPRPHF